MNSDIVSLIIILICVMLSAYFSATETSFTSLNRIRMKNMAEKGDKRAELVLKLLENFDKLLSTILVGNNIVNNVATTIGAVLFIKLIGSAEGGVENETLAATAPEKTAPARVDIAEGLGGYHVNNLIYGMGLSGDLGKQVGAVVRGLYKTFRAYDAQLAEITPLFITRDGKAHAGHGKLIIHANSVWRPPHYPLTRDYFDSEVEFEAAQEGIPYLLCKGDIALICAGAGLTTTVFDLINDAGGNPATYVEFGGANYTKAVRTMELCLMTPSKVILVVTFGTIARADVMAQGLVEAIKVHQPKQPIVTCIRGTNEDEAFKILRDAGLEPLTNTEEAVQRAVDIAAGRAQ